MSGRATNKTPIVVFASGRGTNFRAICQAVRDEILPATVQALICNVEGAGAIAVAKEFDIPAVVVPNSGLMRSSHEEQIVKALSRFRFEWIVLAGYMRLFTPEFVRRFKMVNIHPSLLPSFPGKDAYAQALRHGVKITGATVHLVGAGMDDGRILAQAVLEIRDGDTEDSLTSRGLKLEHQLYVETLKRLFTGGFAF